MLIVISPAKTLDYATPAGTRKFTQPQYLEQSEILNRVLQTYTPARLGKLMSISSDLAQLNAARNLQWAPPFSLNNARQAIFAFRGDVYTGLDIASFDEADLAYTQQHLRILSGLYGLLRPLDLMQPYRLEMGTSLPTDRGKNLYQFWGDTLTDGINNALKKAGSAVVVNLASQEYFNAVDARLLNGELLTPVFKDYSKGQYKVISFFAKKARGMMAAWILKQRIEDPAGLLVFNETGYCHDPELSTAQSPVFVRRQE